MIWGRTVPRHSGWVVPLLAPSGVVHEGTGMEEVSCH